VRTLNNEVRGFLSDSYRRLDSRPIIEAFVTGVQRLGALPYKGIVTDTKVAIQAILPDVFETVIPGEVLAFVLSLENSDFGNGALSLRVGALRIWCDNLSDLHRGHAPDSPWPQARRERRVQPENVSAGHQNDRQRP
jgi:hypothetical protein